MSVRSDAKNRKYITIKDVAKHAGTSIATVSYVLNDSKDRYISSELRERVLQAAEELNYIKSGLASSLKGKERGIIAVLTPQFENHFFMSIFIAIEKITNQYGYVLSTCNTFDSITHEQEVLERMTKLRVDGYLIIPTVQGAENTKQIRSHGLPFVAIERPLDGVEGYDFVTSDNFDAAYTITNHLIGMGHREIGFIFWDTEISNLYERYLGYEQALKDHQIPYCANYVKKGKITHLDGAVLTDELLKERNVTAIVYGHYILAEGGIQYARNQGVRIPEDISMVLIGAPYWTRMNDTPFTCIVQPGTQMGEEAAELLLKKIDNDHPPRDFIHKKIKCSIYYGKSVKDLRIQ